MRENYIQSEYAETWLENDIIYQVFKPHFTTINIQIAKQLVLDRVKASNSQTVRPVLVEVGNSTFVDKETRKYYETEEPFRYISATAMLVDNYVAKLIGNIMLKVRRPPIPVALFNDKEKALQWLEKYKPKNLN